jgi:hypothetical protein
VILSASRRTDIPAFYTDWFMERIREGYLCVRNPFNPRQVSRFSVTPDVTDCIVFWTKDPSPMIPRLEELSGAGYMYYFQFTLNSYGADIEPGVPPYDQRITAFRELSKRLGSRRVVWRYDPIIFTEKYTPEWHIAQFCRTAELLRGATNRCVISFVDVYAKNKKAMERIHASFPGIDDIMRFAGGISEAASRNGIEVNTCAEPYDLEKAGIHHGGCIDRGLIEELLDCRIDAVPDAQRPNCRCIHAEEAGAYGTCPHGCVYCYAGGMRKNTPPCDPASPLLCSTIDPDRDKITERPVKPLRR